MVVTVAAVRAGETVLVPSASGGVAGAAVQAARLAGARVIASVGAADKVESVRALGADVVFCYRDVPVAEAVAEATGGRGVDAVVETTGGPRFGEHLAAMAPDGRLVTCGAHAGEVVPLDIIELFRHGHRILGFRVATPDEIRSALGWRWTAASACRSTAPSRWRGGRRPRLHGRAPARRQDRAGGRMTRVCCYLAHCLLNANAKVDEGARCPGRLHPGAGAAARARRQHPPDALSGAGVRRHPPVLGGARAVRHPRRSAPTAGGWRRRWRSRCGPTWRPARGW